MRHDDHSARRTLEALATKVLPDLDW